MEIPGTLRIDGRLTLMRAPREGEREAAARQMAAGPETSRWWSADEGKVGRWLADPSAALLIIESGGRSAGIVQLYEEPDPDYRSASIDIAVFDTFQGQGVGADALRAVARWLFTEGGHHRITIDPAVANIRAVHVYEKVGFRPVGVMRDYERSDDGGWHDNLLLDLLPEDLTEP